MRNLMLKMNVFSLGVLLMCSFVSIKSERKLQGARYAGYREFLYIVSIQEKMSKDHRCSGVLVTLKHVMTAGQCIANFDEKVGISIRDHHNSIVYGVSRFTKDIEIGLYRYIKSWHVHPKLDFAQNTFWTNDIAIIALNGGFSEDIVNPVTVEIPLANSNSTSLDIKDNVSEKCYVIGWGWNRFLWQPERDESSESSVQLKVVPIGLIRREECEVKIRGVNPTFSFFNLSLVQAACAEPILTPNNSCFGEPGAPLVCNDLLVGLSSWFVGCGAGTRQGPLVYSDKHPILDFYVNYGFDSEPNLGRKNSAAVTLVLQSLSFVLWFNKIFK